MFKNYILTTYIQKKNKSNQEFLARWDLDADIRTFIMNIMQKCKPLF